MNSMYFNEESRDLMMKFIKNLCDMSYNYDGDIRYYNEICIKPEDCGAFSVNWEQLPWNGEYGGGFQYVDEDQCVCTDLEFPDRHFEYVPVGTENDYLTEWLDQNPGWYKNEYGHWVRDDVKIIDHSDEYKVGEKPRFTFTAVDSSTGEPILNGVHLDDDNIVSQKVRKDLGLDTENYEPKKSEHFQMKVSDGGVAQLNADPNREPELSVEQEDELREGIDPKNFEAVKEAYIDWGSPTTTAKAKPNWYVDYTEPYKYSVGDD